MIEIVPPTERECERCGRQEVWDEDDGVWCFRDESGTADPGRAHCLHEWDINGAYSPVADV